MSFPTQAHDSLQDRIPKVTDVDTSLIQNTENVGVYTYLGKAMPGTGDAASLWQIIRIEGLATGIKLRFADGSTKMDKTWDDRASYTYA